MYKKEVLGLQEAQKMVDTILSEAMKDPNRPIAVMVVDERGELVCGARMDGAYPLFSHLALNKAYTAARMLTDTNAFALRQRELDQQIGTWGDLKMTDLEGGLCIIGPGPGYNPVGPDGTVIGGVGVSGREGSEDIALAKLGLNAIAL